jgi:hypothetical protein
MADVPHAGRCSVRRVRERDAVVWKASFELQNLRRHSPLKGQSAEARRSRRRAPDVPEAGVGLFVSAVMTRVAPEKSLPE